MLRMRASHSSREIGYSSAKPLPPWICSALSAQAQDAGAKQLGHAGLEVATLVVVFLPGREIGELARHHDLHRHHRELAGDAGEVDQRLAELLAVFGVLQAHFERVLGHADGAGGGLDAGGLEGLHQLLEALVLLAAEQVGGGHAEAVEAELVFLHAAVAEHLDLAAGHALGGEVLRFVARLLLGDEH